MGAFKDLELKWRGETYAIKSHRVMGAICRIEEIITLPELRKYSDRGTAPIAKLASAYAEVLRYAGAKVTADEVYAAALDDTDMIEGGVMVAVMQVMELMIPPATLKRIHEDQELKNSNATMGEASSKKPTKPSSRKTNG